MNLSLLCFGRISRLGLASLLERCFQEWRSLEKAQAMSPEDIIREACKLPLPALDKVVKTLDFEILGRLQDSSENEMTQGRCHQ